MCNPIEIDVVTQSAQATDLALENLLGELDDDPTRIIKVREGRVVIHIRLVCTTICTRAEFWQP